MNRLRKDNIIARIVVEKEGDFLSINTILQIVDAIVEVASIDYAELIKQARESNSLYSEFQVIGKRACFDNLKKYIALWQQNIEDVEQLIDNTRKTILKKLNIDNTLWENTNAHYVVENNYQLYMMHATIPQRLKYREISCQ